MFLLILYSNLIVRGSVMKQNFCPLRQRVSPLVEIVPPMETTSPLNQRFVSFSFGSLVLDSEIGLVKFLLPAFEFFHTKAKLIRILLLNKKVKEEIATYLEGLKKLP